MKVGRDITIFAGDNGRVNRGQEAVEKTERKQQEVKLVFAGKLNMQPDRVMQKREEAKQKAMKVIKDAWAGDRVIDDDLSKRREHIWELRKEMDEASKGLQAIDDKIQSLKEFYQVADDSQEQKDLELLLKREKSNRAGSTTVLTEEDREQLAEISKNKLTEYQERSLETYKQGERFDMQIYKNKLEISMESAIITGIKLERLKSHPMVDATQKAEEILDAATEEIIGMLMDDVKDHIDEEQQKREEQADKIKEKEKEEEELTKKQKERSEEEEEILKAVTEELLVLDQAKGDVKSEVEKIVDKMKLVVEDIKGVMVDKTV